MSPQPRPRAHREALSGGGGGVDVWVPLPGKAAEGSLDIVPAGGPRQAQRLVVAGLSAASAGGGGGGGGAPLMKAPPQPPHRCCTTRLRPYCPLCEQRRLRCTTREQRRTTRHGCRQAWPGPRASCQGAIAAIPRRFEARMVLLLWSVRSVTRQHVCVAPLASLKFGRSAVRRMPPSVNASIPVACLCLLAGPATRAACRSN